MASRSVWASRLPRWPPGQTRTASLLVSTGGIRGLPRWVWPEGNLKKSPAEESWAVCLWTFASSHSRPSGTHPRCPTSCYHACIAWVSRFIRTATNRSGHPIPPSCPSQTDLGPLWACKPDWQIPGGHLPATRCHQVRRAAASLVSAAGHCWMTGLGHS